MTFQIGDWVKRKDDPNVNKAWRDSGIGLTPVKVVDVQGPRIWVQKAPRNEGWLASRFELTNPLARFL